MHHVLFILFIACFIYNTAFPSTSNLAQKSVSRPPTSAAQFSGALQWAQKNSITGKNLGAIVMEPSPLTPQIFRISSPSLMVTPDMFEAPKKSHAQNVIDTLLEIAPRSTTTLINSNFNLDVPYYYDMTKQSPLLVPRLKESFAVNVSFGFSPSSLDSQVKKNPSDFSAIQNQQRDILYVFRKLTNYGNKKLFVLAAGNIPSSLNTPITTNPLNYSEKIYALPKEMIKDPELRKHTIIAGSLSQNFTKSVYSNYPGWDEKLQKNVLHTLGEKIPSRSGLISGTSFSAPIVTGCVLLIKEKYPNLTIFEIKEALLESASKSFFIPQETIGKKYRAIWVYDPKESFPDSTSFPNDRYNITLVPFDAKSYGRGVLDLRAAFVYAEIRSRNRGLKKEMIYKKMREELKGKDEQAAIVIQSAFRDYLTKKNKEPLLNQDQEPPKIYGKNQ